MDGPVPHRLEVGAGAEGTVPGAGDDRDLDIRVGVYAGECRTQLLGKLRGHRVQYAWPVQGEHPDRPVVLGQHGVLAGLCHASVSFHWWIAA
jgi:hypothetical protein